MQDFYIMQEKEGRSHVLCVVVTYLTPPSSPIFSLLTPTFSPFTPSDLLLLLLPSLLTSTHVHPNNSLLCVCGRRGRSQFTFSLLIYVSVCLCVCVSVCGLQDFGLTMGVGWSTGWVEAAARFWSGSRSTHHLCVECVAPPGTNTCM